MKQMLLLFTLILVSPCCAQTQKGNNPKPENCDAVIVQRCDSCSERIATDNKIICYLIEMPSFPGGQDSLKVFIARNLRWPGTGCECVQGRVICEFTVEKDGTCTGFKVMRSLHPAFDEEALRVLRLMPKWIPGRDNGKSFRSNYVIPITFRLQ